MDPLNHEPLRSYPVTHSSSLSPLIAYLGPQIVTSRPEHTKSSYRASGHSIRRCIRTRAEHPPVHRDLGVPPSRAPAPAGAGLGEVSLQRHHISTPSWLADQVLHEILGAVPEPVCQKTTIKANNQDTPHARESATAHFMVQFFQSQPKMITCEIKIRSTSRGIEFNTMFSKLNDDNSGFILHLSPHCSYGGALR
jgi:hypothetical protein